MTNQKPFLRAIDGQTTVQVFLCNRYQMIRDVADHACEPADDHAGEMDEAFEVSAFHLFL